MKYHISGAKINKCFDFAKYLGRFLGPGSETAWNGGYFGGRGRRLFAGTDVEGVGGGAVDEESPAVGVELGGYERYYLG